VLALAAAALLWLARSPWLNIRAIQLEGELDRNSVASIRANAAPRLHGNLVDRPGSRARRLRGVPWVRQAVVRRIWPDRLAVQLVEHRPVALWLGDDGNTRLVNDRGEVFEANVGDVEDDQLPEFSGPDGSSAQMLALYRRLEPMFSQQRMRPVALQQSGRGSFSLELDNGATVGWAAAARTSWPSAPIASCAASARSPIASSATLEYADLRHADGYAVRLRGITTTLTPAAKAAKKPR
jgi:cell division protein FtsQ